MAEKQMNKDEEPQKLDKYLSGFINKVVVLWNFERQNDNRGIDWIQQVWTSFSWNEGYKIEKANENPGL